jgi:type II secretory pathway pseudopilin PulG
MSADIYTIPPEYVERQKVRRQSEPARYSEGSFLQENGLMIVAILLLIVVAIILIVIYISKKKNKSLVVENGVDDKIRQQQLALQKAMTRGQAEIEDEEDDGKSDITPKQEEKPETKQNEGQKEAEPKIKQKEEPSTETTTTDNKVKFEPKIVEIPDQNIKTPDFSRLTRSQAPSTRPILKKNIPPPPEDLIEKQLTTEVPHKEII